ncbi:MAG TPA: malto-oligosyltrehalose synthase [Lacipirellulaceae bacterium]
MAELTATKSAESVRGNKLNRVPVSTYRLQLNAECNLDTVFELLPYLERLGISDLYLSPLFRAREESSHGYDVVDHGAIDPAIGDLAAFQRVAEEARGAGMGILLDVVPNHMGINDPGNAWWLDVLENGEAAYFAGFFDIDWRPAASALQNKILLPFLGEPFGKVLENGELRVINDDRRLQLGYGPHRYPLAPPTWTEILDLALLRAHSHISNSGGDSAPWTELQSIITQLRHLPPASRRDAAAMDERYREQKIVRRRLSELVESSAAVRTALDEALIEINGEIGNPRSFDQLEKLLEAQWYRLAFWRVAADEINYRRFFDINELAAIRVEEPRVFDAVHRLVGQFLRQGWVTGLRIDHPDGLRDPQTYFKNLQALYRSEQPDGGNAAPEIYIVAEKILSADEPLPTDWAICGTTGYAFMNILSRVQVHEQGLMELRKFYDGICGGPRKPVDIVYESKRTVLLESMSSELQMLTAQLYRIAQQHRAARDFTRPSLQRALREVIACMNVYRTYVRADSWDVSESDYRTVTTAVRMAKRRNRTLSVSVFDFIASVLLLEHPPTLSDEQAAERRLFALKVQQVTGPVAAKGVEDTAFYRYYPLASLNEVGGDLDARPLSAEEFHRLMRQRAANWPHALSATATHDSKRGEGMRARLHVLSEAAHDWAEAFMRWQRMNREFVRDVDGEPVPDANEEYLIYQTLVGTWPVKPMSPDEMKQYEGRIVQYLQKAFREAKTHTSWMNPSEAFETAAFDFVRDLLGPPGEPFRADLTAFVNEIADSGFVNSLAQTLLKITLPGVPDFYQGCELWDFNLVDPDNRRPIDFEERRTRLDQLLRAADTDLEQTARDLARRWPSADIKLWVTARSLALRRDWTDVFSFGDYLPLTGVGPAENNLLSFARQFNERCAITAVPRHFHQLCGSQREPKRGTPRADWQGTQLVLPQIGNGAWNCVLCGRTFEARGRDGKSVLDVAAVLDVLPVALLTSESQ